MFDWCGRKSKLTNAIEQWIKWEKERKSRKSVCQSYEVYLKWNLISLASIPVFWSSSLCYSWNWAWVSCPFTLGMVSHWNNTVCGKSFTAKMKWSNEIIELFQHKNKNTLHLLLNRMNVKDMRTHTHTTQPQIVLNSIQYVVSCFPTIFVKHASNFSNKRFPSLIYCELNTSRFAVCCRAGIRRNVVIRWKRKLKSTVNNRYDFMCIHIMSRTIKKR